MTSPSEITVAEAIDILSFFDASFGSDEGSRDESGLAFASMVATVKALNRGEDVQLNDRGTGPSHQSFEAVLSMVTKVLNK